MDQSNLNRKLLIKPTKYFCRNRILLKNQNSPLSVFVQKVLDFLLYLSYETGSLQLQFSPYEFFVIADLRKPNGKQYKDLYTALGVLYDTTIYWIDNRYTNFTHVLGRVSFVTEKKRINSIVVHLNPELSKVLLWRKNNIIQNLKITMALKRKYSYYLYILLLEDFIQNGEVHVYKRMQLRNYLVADVNENEKHFKIYLRSAIKEINLVTGWKLTIKISKNIYFIRNELCQDESCTEITELNNHSFSFEMEDEFRFLMYEKEYRKCQKQYEALKAFPKIGEIIDEQTRKRRREL